MMVKMTRTLTKFGEAQTEGLVSIKHERITANTASAIEIACRASSQIFRGNLTARLNNSLKSLVSLTRTRIKPAPLS